MFGVVFFVYNTHVCVSLFGVNTRRVTACIYCGGYLFVYTCMCSMLGRESAGSPDPDVFCSEIVWKVLKISEKLTELPKGASLWSPEFDAAGIRGMQIEFFPNGRESATMSGYCSVFFWCPENTCIKYQVQVGQTVRAPDEDTFETRMGHGHSNFCLLGPEICDDSVEIRIEILDVKKEISFGSGLSVLRPSISKLMNRFSSVFENRNVSHIEWKIDSIAKKIANFPRGASMYSPVFSAGGIRDVLIEFYPNGNVTTVRDGFCALYLRCPEGTSVIVTLGVGNMKKGPITAKFEGNAGKGLPEFCHLPSQIINDQISISLEIKNTQLDTGGPKFLLL